MTCGGDDPQQRTLARTDAIPLQGKLRGAAHSYGVQKIDDRGVLAAAQIDEGALQPTYRGNVVGPSKRGQVWGGPA
jgi:hypothetical protein